ncbi:hypothetical protein GF312_22425 [Candidatus Poribacteria bacterium]|nr:hypothetical protein [Candidatus Poribacteria bacterium]
MKKSIWQFGTISFVMVLSVLFVLTNHSLCEDTFKQTQIHELPLLPEGQHLSYIEGFNPDNPPELRKVMDEAFQESLDHGMKVARIQMDWPDVEPTKGIYKKQELIERLEFYHSKELAIFLLLCTADTDDLNYPEDLLDEEEGKLANDMKPDHPDIIKRYNKMLDWAIPIAKEYGVYCISVGNEPDTHQEDDPTFMMHFIKFVAAVREHAHTIDPDIAITYTTTCDPVLHPYRKYGKYITDSVDILCFNFYGFGGRMGFNQKKTEKIFDGMVKLAKGKPMQIQELGCSSINNPDTNWLFYESSESIQSSFFQWFFKKMKTTEQMRAAYVFQLVDHSPFIDELYYNAFHEEHLPEGWTRKLCDWLKGLGLISFKDAKKKEAWNEFLKGLELMYGESG